MRPVVILVATLLLLSGCSAESDTGAKQVNDRLPDVTLQPLGDGKPVNLAGLRGPMVVNLWASWCAPCRDELPQYQAFAKKYAGKVDVLGVDWQETRAGAARKLAGESGVTYPLVTDPDGKLRTQVLPKLILLDGDGRVAYQEYVKITSVAQLESLVEKHLKVPAA
jgi:cytochrome c biogenesis protein CcmG/thiol:disulfide interchange protein DsbE